MLCPQSLKLAIVYKMLGRLLFLCVNQNNKNIIKMYSFSGSSKLTIVFIIAIKRFKIYYYFINCLKLHLASLLYSELGYFYQKSCMSINLMLIMKFLKITNKLLLSWYIKSKKSMSQTTSHAMLELSFYMWSYFYILHILCSNLLHP